MNAALPDLQRTSVVGTSGSGKTTFGKALAAACGTPFIELDAIHWGPDWTELDTDAFRCRVAAAAAAGSWVMDGNYAKVRDLVWARATSIVWLNYSLPRTFWQVFTRTVRRVFTRQKLYAGNVESFREAFFSRGSLLWWVLTTHGDRRRRFADLFAGGTYEGTPVIEFRRPAQAAAFLQQVGAG